MKPIECSSGFNILGVLSMVQQVKFKDDLGDDVLRVVGQITISFAQLEYVLKLSVKRLLGKPFSEGMGIAESIWPIPKLCQEAERLFELKVMDQASEAEFRNLLDDVKKLTEPRHAVVHALWARTMSGQAVRIRRGVDYGVNLRELRQLRMKIRTVLNALNQFTRTHVSPSFVGGRP